MALAKLETGKRVGDQAFEAIQDAIMRGELPAGRRLQIRQLASELGISVMPVREAMKRLEEQGLVETTLYRGAQVKRFTAQELLQLYAVRRLLEVEASRLGAAAFPAAKLPLLERLFNKMRDSITKGQIIDYLDQDERLLSAIYAASENPVLIESIDLLWRRCRTYKIFGANQEYESGNLAELLVHQEHLVQAVKDRDAQAAGEITAASLDAAIDRIRLGLPGSSDPGDD